MSNCSTEHSPLATATASLPSLLLNVALFQDSALSFPSLPSNFLHFSFSSRRIYSCGSRNYLVFSLPGSFATSFCWLVRSIWSSLQHLKRHLAFLLPWSYINICLFFIIFCLHSTSLRHKSPQTTWIYYLSSSPTRSNSPFPTRGVPKVSVYFRLELFQSINSTNLLQTAFESLFTIFYTCYFHERLIISFWIYLLIVSISLIEDGRSWLKWKIWNLKITIQIHKTELSLHQFSHQHLNLGFLVFPQ